MKRQFPFPQLIQPQIKHILPLKTQFLRSPFLVFEFVSCQILKKSKSCLQVGGVYLWVLCVCMFGLFWLVGILFVLFLHHLLSCGSPRAVCMPSAFRAAQDLPVRFRFLFVCLPLADYVAYLVPKKTKSEWLSFVLGENKLNKLH